MGLFDLFSDKNEAKARDLQVQGYRTGESRAMDYLGQGMGALRGNYASALDEYAPYAQSGQAASSLYSDALGLNGSDGSGRAVSAFQSSPGYDYAVNQALQAVERRASAQGQLGSGQTTLDTLGAVHGLADQDYGSWLDRLNGQQTVGMNAAAGRAGIDTGLGNAEYTYGTNRGDLAYNTETGIGNANADYEKNKDQTGANIFGAITGGLSLGAKVLGLGGFGV
jgi:hypothetical protein